MKKNFSEDTKEQAKATAISELTGPDTEQKAEYFSEPLRCTFSLLQSRGNIKGFGTASLVFKRTKAIQKEQQ